MGMASPREAIARPLDHSTFFVRADGELPFCDTARSDNRRSQESTLDTRVRNRM